MIKQDLKLSDKDIDEFTKQFSKRYIFKKKINALLCFFISLCGISAVLYSRFIFKNPLLDRLRYMTFWGTIFTSIVSFVFGIAVVALPVGIITAGYMNEISNVKDKEDI